MAQYKDFDARWVGVWRGQDGNYINGATPIRTGGSTGYNSLIGFQDDLILEFLNSSQITPKVWLVVNVTDGGAFDVGMHQETGNKASDGIPFYVYAQRSYTLQPGWNSLDITDIKVAPSGGATVTGFKNMLTAGYKGPVLYGAVGSDYGEAYGITNNSNSHAYIQIYGQWDSKPGKPKVLAPTAGQQVEKEFELKASAALDAQQDASQLRYEWSVYDGTAWTYLGFGAYGVTNKVVDFDTYAETTKAQVAVRANDGTNTGDWAYSSTFTITKNHPPSAPTLKSPVGGAQVDRMQDTVFSWTHNDAGNQSAYDFQWRVQGTEAWTVVPKRTTTNQTHVVASSTFPVGTIEWTVRTYDTENLVGPFATSGIFDSTEPSGAPTITDPVNASSVTSSRVVVTWSAPEQASYELQLVELSNDATTQTVLWTENVVSEDKTREIPIDLKNNTTYEVYVRVDTVAGLWSNWAKSRFTTSFTPPSVPTLTTAEQDADGSITITIENPAPSVTGEPTVIRNDIYRRVYASGEDFIRIANNIEPNGFYTDYRPGSDITYEYMARSYGDNDTIRDSAPITASITIKDTFISLASNPAQYVILMHNPSRSISRGVDRTMLQFNGRKYPIAEFGEHQTSSISLSFDIRDAGKLNILIDLIEAKQALLYRDGRGRRDFVTVDSLSIKDVLPNRYNVSFSPEKVDYREEV